jgi:hypothetical protein
MEVLLLFGLPSALLAVFAWRSEPVTGAIGTILGVFCAAWIVQVIQANDAMQTWNASLLSHDGYNVLVAGCGVAIVTSSYSFVMGVANVIALRRRALVLVPDKREGPVGVETRCCPHCGERIRAEALVCAYCEKDVFPRAR